MKKPQERITIAQFKQAHRLTTPPQRPKRDYPGELLEQLQFAGLPLPVREFRFDPVRKWRFDLAFPEILVGIEIEGLLYASEGKSRHQTVGGYSQDCEKYNAATIAGWRVLRCTQQHVKSGQSLAWIREMLDASS